MRTPFLSRSAGRALRLRQPGLPLQHPQWPSHHSLQGQRPSFPLRAALTDTGPTLCSSGTPAAPEPASPTGLRRAPTDAWRLRRSHFRTPLAPVARVSRRAQARAGPPPLAAVSAVESGQVDQEWEQEIEELMKLVQLLPVPVRSALESHPSMLELLEVVMDLGRAPLARFPSGDIKLSSDPISAADLDYAVAQVGEFGGDNRAGIDRTLHRISCMRNRTGRIIGLTCRVGRAVKGSAQMVRDLVLSGASILLLGRPGVGKTTAIREVSRMLADECAKRVVIVDTSNEIGGDGDIPHGGIGRARRMQVAAPEAQHRVMIEAVENHMPQVIVIDEIGTAEECSAARTIAQRGVQLVATAHGNELENVIKNPQLADLVGGIQSVTLGDEEAKRRGVQKSILERAAPPTFDVCIEMLERTKWRVHLDVGQAVDVVLAGGESGGQVRERAVDGTILKYNYNPAISGVIRGAARTGGSGGGGGGSGATGAGAARVVGATGDAADLPPGAGGSPTSRASGSSFIRTPVASLSVDDGDGDSAAAAAVVGDGDFGVGKRLRRVLSRQAVGGATAEAATLRLFPYELDEDVLWEVMKEMQLLGKIYITTSLATADAVLALRAKVKHNSELRSMAREADVPIYAVKTSGSANLIKAFRTLLGVDPSAGGTFGPASDSEEGRTAWAAASPNGTASASDDEADSSGRASSSNSSATTSSTSSGGGGKGYGYKAWAEEEALREAQVAVTEIVVPLGQPVELMPRAQSVLEAQMAMLDRYKLPYEVIGSGVDARLRILPRAASEVSPSAPPPSPPSSSTAVDTANEQSASPGGESSSSNRPTEDAILS